VKDGNTLVIGGLIKDDLKKTDVKVPWFGKLPVLKNMFRSNKTQNSRTELLMFVTPKIIYPESNLKVATKDYPEICKAQISYNSLLNRRLKRDEKKNKGEFPKNIPLFNTPVEVKVEKKMGSNNNLKEIPSLTKKLKKKIVRSSRVAKVVETKKVTVQKSVAKVEPTIKKVEVSVVTNKPLRSIETQRMISELKRKSNETNYSSKVITSKRKVIVKKKNRVKRNSLVKVVKSFSKKLKRKNTQKVVSKVEVEKVKTIKKSKLVRVKKNIVKTKPLRSKEAMKMISELKKKSKEAKISSKPITKKKKLVVKTKKMKKKTISKAKTIKKSSKKMTIFSKKNLNKLARESFLKKVSELNLSSSDLSERLSKKERKSVIEEMKKNMASTVVNGGVM
jgi:type II secretory pathway component GspD/PulD (secretin)